MPNGLDVLSDGQTTLLGILPMILTPVQSFKARTGYAPYSIRVYECELEMNKLPVNERNSLRK